MTFKIWQNGDSLTPADLNNNFSQSNNALGRDNPKSAGLIGDGAFRPLGAMSSATIYGQVTATTGYTLTQWQTLLPAATSLSNGFDRLVLQKFINDAAGNRNVIVDQDTHVIIDATIVLPGYTNLILNGSIVLANGVNSHIIKLQTAGDYISISGKGILDGNKVHQTFNTDSTNFGNGGIVTSIITYPNISNRHVKIRDITIQNVLNWPISLNNSSFCEVTGTTLINSGNAPQFMGGTTYSIASNNTMANIPDYAWATYEGCSFCTVSNNIATNCGPFGCLNDGDGTFGWNNIAQHDILIEGNIISACIASGVTVATVVTGVSANFLYNISVRGNTINDALDAAIVLSGVRNSVVDGNSISGGHSSGTTWNGMQGIAINMVISNNSIINGGSNGSATSCSAFNVANMSLTIYSNNYIYDSAGTMQHAFAGSMGVGAALQFRENIIGTLAGAAWATDFYLQPDTVYIGAMVSNSPIQNYSQPVVVQSGLGSIGTLTGGQWAAQGAWVGWNQSVGVGATSFVNSRGLGQGGFEFFDVASNSTATPLLISKLDAGGNLTLTGHSMQLKNGTSLHRKIESIIYAQGTTTSPISLTTDGGTLTTGNTVLQVPLNCCVRVRAEVMAHNLTSAQACTWVIDAIVAVSSTYSTANIPISTVTARLPGTAPTGFSVTIAVSTTTGAIDIAGTCTVSGTTQWQAEVTLGISGA